MASIEPEVHCDYDSEGDVLYVFWGAPYPTTNITLDANFTLRFDVASNELVGLTILDLLSLFPGARRAGDLSLLGGALLRTFRQLHQERKLKEPSVA